MCQQKFTTCRHNSQNDDSINRRSTMLSCLKRGSAADISGSRLGTRSNFGTRSKFGTRRGAVSLMLLLSLVVIMLGVALIWNYQIMVLHRTDLQNQSDMIAVAGAKSAVNYFTNHQGGFSTSGTGSSAVYVFNFEVDTTNKLSDLATGFSASTQGCFDQNAAARSGTQMAGAVLPNNASTRYYPKLWDSSTTSTAKIPFIYFNSDRTVGYTSDHTSSVNFPLYVVVKMTKPRKLIINGDAQVTGSALSNDYEVFTGIRIDCTKTTSGATNTYALTWQICPVSSETGFIPGYTTD